LCVFLFEQIRKQNKNVFVGRARSQNASKVTPKTANAAKMEPKRRQMEPHDAPEAPPLTPKGDRWSPNGRPKAPKAGQGPQKPAEDMPEEPNET